MSLDKRTPHAPIDPSDILVVHQGPGANCSSIGSALDMLFVSAAAAGALFVAIAAAFGRRPPPDKPQQTLPPNARKTGEPALSSSGQIRARAEPFGAWVQMSDGALVALNRKGARAIGIDGAAVWRKPPDAAEPGVHDHIPASPLEAHVAVTSKCTAGCTGCYLDASPGGDSPPLSVLEGRLAALARASVFTVAFGGGEPLMRQDLPELAQSARALGLLPVLTTSGIGLTRERAKTLKDFAQVNVSFDGMGEHYAAVRGYDGTSTAERAMRHLENAGIPFGINTVLTRQSFPVLSHTLARAQALGAREAQLLRYKPAGRAKHSSYFDARLSEEQALGLWPAIEHIAHTFALKLRIDCALVPLLGAAPLHAQDLARFGVFGCEAGRFLRAVRIDGSASPCSFDSAPDREPVQPPAAEPCLSCGLREICRGGCRIVSDFIRGASSPDPECPRVIAHERAAGTPFQRTTARHLHVTR